MLDILIPIQSLLMQLMQTQSMPSQDPLAQLRDIYLPEPVGFWPLAPGWWLLLVITIITVITTIYAIRKRIIRNRYRRQALAQLNNLNLVKLNPSDQVQHINQLLKQTALASKTNSHVANLSGKKWLAFLDQSGKTDHFSNGIGQVLEEGPYNPKLASFDTEELLTLTKRWIKQHSIAKGSP